jgi:hypothetical protein
MTVEPVHLNIDSLFPKLLLLTYEPGYPGCMERVLGNILVTRG